MFLSLQMIHTVRKPSFLSNLCIRYLSKLFLNPAIVTLSLYSKFISLEAQKCKEEDAEFDVYIKTHFINSFQRTLKTVQSSTFVNFTGKQVPYSVALVWQYIKPCLPMSSFFTLMATQGEAHCLISKNFYGGPLLFFC